ncbi:MAG: hypothetical protein FWD89_00330 [Firmicutes bacterium]|nr:hypothetical protein [Bacillota bacterium]
MKKFKHLFLAIPLLFSIFLMGCDAGGDGNPWKHWTPPEDWRPTLGQEVIVAADVVSPIPFISNGHSSWSSMTPDLFQYYEKVGVIFDSRIHTPQNTWGHPFFAVVQNTTELAMIQPTVATLHGCFCDDPEFGQWCDCPFKDLETRYNEAYFENNILILYYVHEGYFQNINWPSTIEEQNGILVVNFNRYALAMLPATGSFSYEINIARTDFTATSFAYTRTNVIDPSSSITVSIKDSHFHRVKEESFTTNDFWHPNIAGVRYQYWEWPNIGARYAYIEIFLNENGTARATEIANYFNGKPFADDIYIGWW